MNAIVRFFNGKNNRRDSLSRCGAYICNPLKAPQHLIGGQGIHIEHGVRDMLTTKKLHNKTSGKQHEHFIVSFHPDSTVTPEDCYCVAAKIALFYEEFQVLYSVHTNREHLHIHFVINSVNAVTGKKFSQWQDDLARFKEYVYEIVKSYGITQISLEYDENDYTDSGEEEIEEAWFDNECSTPEEAAYALLGDRFISCAQFNTSEADAPGDGFDPEDYIAVTYSTFFGEHTESLSSLRAQLNPTDTEPDEEYTGSGDWDEPYSEWDDDPYDGADEEPAAECDLDYSLSDALKEEKLRAYLGENFISFSRYISSNIACAGGNFDPDDYAVVTYKTAFGQEALSLSDFWAMQNPPDYEEPEDECLHDMDDEPSFFRNHSGNRAE